MSLIIKKFGGSLLSSIDKITTIAQKIAESYHRGYDIVVIASAMGEETDRLINLARKISKNPVPREYDVLISSGEQVSCALLAIALSELGIAACSYLGWQVRIKTNSTNKNAEILNIDTDILKSNILDRKISVLAGFQGVDEDNNITTLGRGGSDATAVAIASVLKADTCMIYTDVEGVYAVDPRLVENPNKFSEISYDQMLILSKCGAQVMQPYSIEIAKKHNIVLIVSSGTSYKNSGTVITSEVKENNDNLLLGISVRRNNSLFSFKFSHDTHNILSKALDKLTEQGINITILENKKDKRSELIFVSSGRNYFHIFETVIIQPEFRQLIDYQVNKNVAIINLVVIKNEYSLEIIEMTKRKLQEENIKIFFLKTYGSYITLIIEEDLLKNAISSLSKCFGLTSEGKIKV